MDKVFTEEEIWEEVDDFLRLDKRLFGLPVDILADECFMCEYYNHVLIVFFRNSYNPHEHNYIPVSVSDNPKILSDKKINLYRVDVIKILNWVRVYRNYLINLSTRLVDFDDLCVVAAVNSKRRNKLIKEGCCNKPLYQIYEMAVLNKELSGLNWDIWLDDNELYKKGGHAMRIKVQNFEKSPSSKQWNPFILHSSKFSEDVKDKYSYSDRCSISKFVDANYDLIMDLANNKISFDVFKDRFRKVYKISGSKWEAENKVNVDEPKYVIAYPLKYGYDVVYSAEQGGYNVLNPNGNLMMDDWVMSVDNRVLYDMVDGVKSMYFLVYTFDDRVYKLYHNSRLKLIK